MSDDSKPPKGPLLPDPTDPKRMGDKSTNIIDIKEALKERKENRKQKKEAKKDRQQPKKEKPKKKIKTTVESVESADPVDPVKKKAKEEREKFNDKTRMERLRKKVQGLFARFATEILPSKKSASGNNPTRAPTPSHPLLEKMKGKNDREVSPVVDEGKYSREEHQLLHQHQLTKQNQKQNQNTSTPTFRPPGS